MATVLLCLVFARKKLDDCIRPEVRAEWQMLRWNDCVDSFTADAVANIFPENVVKKTQTI